MAPKKGSAKKAAAAPNKNWEAGLATAQLGEESWRACVCLVVGSSGEDEELMEALALAVQRPQRQLFTLLTWDNTLTKIHELGNPKTKKPDDVPMFYEVTESAMLLLDAGEEIPCDLMAKILKFQLLDIKARDQQRRAAKQAEDEQAKNGLPPAKKAPPRKGKGQTSPAQSSKETKLKRRDDVEPPKFIDDEPDDGPQHYVLVLGFYQPQLLGLLDAIGVHVANVIKLCSEHRKTCEVRQEQQRTSEGNEQSQSMSPDLDADLEKAAQAKRLDLFWSGLRPVLDGAPLDSRLHSVAQLSYTVPDLLTSFHVQEPESVPKLGDQIFDGVANLIYDCLDWRRQHQHYIDNIKLISVPTVVVLDCQPAETPRSRKKSVQDQETKLSTDVDMRYYSNLLDLVPPEACSVPLILHCVLEQVVISTEQSDLTKFHVAKRPKPPDDPWLDCELVDHMLQSFLPVVHSEDERSHMLNSLLTVVQNEEDKKRLVEKFGAEETRKKSDHPLVVRHNDERALRLRDISAVQGFDPVEVELTMMKLAPVWELIHSVGHRRMSSSFWMAVKQQLQHYCTDEFVSWSTMERLFHQSVFETMPLTRLDQNGVLLNAAGTVGTLGQAEPRTPTTIPWDSPLSYAKQQLHNSQTKEPTFPTEDSANTARFSGRVRRHVELSDLQSCRLRSLFDWHYAEHHDASIFPQVLQVASEEYRCLDTFRGSHKNILYIFCHNPRSPDYQCKEFWDVALHTDVKFRKYLEHVADIILDWTRGEELKREAMQLRNLSPAEFPTDVKATDSEEEDKTLEPVIRKDSLKAWKLEEERLKVEEMAKKSKKENTPKNKQPKEEAKPTDNNKNKGLADGKKGRAETAGGPANTPGEAITTTVPPVEENEDLHHTEEQASGFAGYGMDGKLIHVSGRLQYLFTSDGGHITVENISYVEGSNLLKVAVKKDGHNFYTHINQVVIYPPPPQGKEINDKKEDCEVSEPLEGKQVKQGSLSAVLNNGVHLSYSFYGPTGEYEVKTQEAEGGSTEAIHLSSTQNTKETDLESVPLKHSLSSQDKLEESKSQVCEGQRALLSSPFNSLNLSVPNGLLLQFLREDTQGESSEEHSMLVRQSFPLHGTGEVSHLRDASLSKELSRIVTCQGTVIRNMRDESTEVLFADGSVSFSQDSGPVWVADSEVEEENPPKEAKNNKKGQKTEKAADFQRGYWLTTTPSGVRICTVGTTHKHLPTNRLLAFKATDPITHEVMRSREDLVVSVQNPDGSLSVEHADGTRITSLCQEKPGEQHEIVTLNATSECVCDCTVDDRECDENMLCKNNKSGCETDKGSVSTKERVLLVEKEGCATVVMYPERHTAHVFLADGTVITGNIQGDYQVFPSDAGILQIQSDGKCVYSSDPLVTPSQKCGAPTNQPGSYTLSHTDKVACDVTDPDGNHFQVMEDGQISVLTCSLAPSTLKNDEEELEEEDREVARLHTKHREPCSRLFLVHEDGSGTELLSAQSVEELLDQAHSDPTIAVLKEPLPDTQDEFGITILKPSHQSVWSQWMLRKRNPDITPPNLRNRTWRDFPSVEKKCPGPPFGSNIGRGLTLRERSAASTAQHQPARSCPKVLEMRELCQHQPFTMLLKNTIDSRLKEYIEKLMEREQQSEDRKVKEPRTEEESDKASDLLNLVLSFTEKEDENHTFDKRSCSVDISGLYNQGVDAQDEQSDVSENTTSDSSPNGKESKWTERLAQYRKELCEEKACRVALRRNNIVPYFHPENIPLYQNLLQNQTPDMRRLSMDLPPIPKSDKAEAFLTVTPQENTPRPLNPTPSQSASHAAGSDRTPEKRPTNPTPQTAGESIWKASSGPYKSVQLDVTGKPRRTKVRIPTSILGSKPCSVPNQQFLSVEDPVRRRCRMISLTDPSVVVRGFQLLPLIVDFGTVQEGSSSVISVAMKNVGVDTCRFHVKPPRPATGLRVLYNPGPVAAGLQAELQVQLFAMSTAQAGEVEPKKYISQDIIIHTETDILYLPVTATILPGRLYEVWLRDHTSAHKKKGSRALELCSSLPDEQGIMHRPSSTLLTRAAAKTGNLNRTTSQ
ncbi:sperm-associated antigen 17 isoform X3 [Scophthalmus maximus]|uniref:sperm-associated antigen 17 isoform X3 n=1 Tax=Scophthalmus maximus TaxID=52904 RepID=UPI001FA8C9AA|nr:sperm-associated antigen 17 isoform X3 [Scophthalmus maximus]